MMFIVIVGIAWSSIKGVTPKSSYRNICKYILKASSHFKLLGFIMYPAKLIFNEMILYTLKDIFCTFYKTYQKSK